ncbi:MAG TPA: pyridoxal-dependent decarboxylase [Candidatus Tumulicola sp.]|jgi:aromatic-L-amino-acid decarboxylase
MNGFDSLERDFASVGRWIAEYYANPEEYRVLPAVRPGDVTARLPERPPEHGESFERIFHDFKEIIVPATTHWNHPRFFAYFATSAEPSAVAAEALAATLDVKAMLWRTSPAATELEQVTMRWLADLLGLPADWTGIIYDTASIAGFTALAAAREALGLDVRRLGMTGRDLPRLRVYISDQTHSHVEKAAIALGIGQDNVVQIPSDANFSMDARELERRIAADIAAGMRPLAIVATAGTTSTTSFDPLDDIADIAERFGIWLHADAAYAGNAGAVPELRGLLRGAERADSFVVNPHKWLFVPMDLSVLFVKDESMVRQAFSLVPEYLTTPETDVVNYMDYGLQLGRRFRALKLWFVLRRLGVEGIRALLREHVALAQQFAARIEASDDWELLAPHPLSVVCFRYCGTPENERNAFNERVLDAVNASGEGFISHTKLRGRYAIRVAIGNLRTTRDDVERLWGRLQTAARELRANQ